MARHGFDRKKLNSLARGKEIANKVTLTRYLSAIKDNSSDDEMFLRSLCGFGRLGKYIEYLDNYFILDAGVTLEKLISNDLLAAEAYIAGYMAYVEMQHELYLKLLNEEFETSKQDLDRRKNEFTSCKNYLKDVRSRIIKVKTSKVSKTELFKEDDDNWSEL